MVGSEDIGAAILQFTQLLEELYNKAETLERQFYSLACLATLKPNDYANTLTKLKEVLYQQATNNLEENPDSKNDFLDLMFLANVHDRSAAYVADAICKETTPLTAKELSQMKMSEHLRHKIETHRKTLAHKKSRAQEEAQGDHQKPNDHYDGTIPTDLALPPYNPQKPPAADNPPTYKSLEERPYKGNTALTKNGSTETVVLATPVLDAAEGIVTAVPVGTIVDAVPVDIATKPEKPLANGDATPAAEIGSDATALNKFGALASV